MEIKYQCARCCRDMEFDHKNNPYLKDDLAEALEQGIVTVRRFFCSRCNYIVHEEKTREYLKTRGKNG